MRLPVSWTLESCDAFEMKSMVGGEAVMVPKGTVEYGGEFLLDALPDAEYVLLDFGDNGQAAQSTMVLNGTPLGDIVARNTAMRYCVPVSVLRAGRNELSLKRRGNIRRAWVDNGEQIAASSEFDLTPRHLLQLLPFEPTGPVDNVEYREHGVVLSTRSGFRIGLRFPNTGTVRVTVGKGDPDEPVFADGVCLTDVAEFDTYDTDEEEGTIRLASSTVVSLVSRGEGELSFYRRDGTTAREGLRFYAAGECTVAVWPLTDAERIYGLGENTTEGMNKRGTCEDIWVIHSFTRCDKPIPFLLSTGGYGLHLHAGRRARFDLGMTLSGRASCFLDGARMDLFVYARRRFPDMVRDYTAMTGRSPLPPRWAFGYWQSSAGKPTQDEWERRIEEFGERTMPIDVVAIDPNWQKPGFQSWEWDTRYFPNPSRFFRTLRGEELQLALWTCPFVNESSPLYKEAAGRGYVMKDESGWVGRVDWWMGFDAALVDFGSKEATAWWGAKAAALVKEGVRVLKVDGGDTHETPPDLVSANGESMKELHNLYPVLFARSVYESMAEAAGEERAITWIRTGFAGIQRYPCCWGGDQNADFGGGRVLIKAGQQAGMMGIPFWSHDLGGFSGKPSEEYYIRSFQWGLLSPMSRAHGSVPAPWALSERASTIVRDFTRLRYRLLPTLYSLAWHSHTTGEPMMRAMALDSQDDPAACAAEYQYRLGPDLLVAPIYEESRDRDLCATRQVYLPAGRWYDYWTDEVREGGRAIEARTPVDRLPLFVRAGGIVVYGEETMRAQRQAADRLEVHVYAGGDGTIACYEDDGRTVAYRRGEYRVTEVRSSATGGGLEIALGASSGTYAGAPERYEIEVVIHGAAEGAAIRPVGEKIPAETRRDGALLKAAFMKRADEALTIHVG